MRVFGVAIPFVVGQGNRGPACHILLAGRLVAAVGLEYAQAKAEQVIDLEGRWVAPGLVDGPLHLEAAPFRAPSPGEGRPEDPGGLEELRQGPHQGDADKPPPPGPEPPPGGEGHALFHEA